VIHHLEEILVCLAPEEVKSGNLEIGPEMAHVILFTLHGVGIHLGRLVVTGVSTEHLLWHVGVGHLGLLVGWGVDKHLPETLGGDVVEALVGRGVAENVGDGFLEFLDGDGESVGFVVLNHPEEGITGGWVNKLDAQGSKGQHTR